MIDTKQCIEAVCRFFQNQITVDPDNCQHKNWKRTSKTGNSTKGYVRHFQNKKNGLVVKVESTDTMLTGLFIEKVLPPSLNVIPVQTPASIIVPPTSSVITNVPSIKLIAGNIDGAIIELQSVSDFKEEHEYLLKKFSGTPVGSCGDIYALAWDGLKDLYVFQTLNGAVVNDYNGDIATVTAPGGVQVIGVNGDILAPAMPDQIISLGWETIFTDLTQDYSDYYDPSDVQGIKQLVNRYNIRWFFMLP